MPATTYDDPGQLRDDDLRRADRRITFSGGVIDNFSFTTEANDQAEFVHVAARPDRQRHRLRQPEYRGLGRPRGHELTPTTTGFTATFSAPLNVSVLNLYDTSGTYGPGRRHAHRPGDGPRRRVAGREPDGTTITFISDRRPPRARHLHHHPGSAARTPSRAPPATCSTATATAYRATTSPPPSPSIRCRATRWWSASRISPAATASRSTCPPRRPRACRSPLSTGENVSGVDLTLIYNPALLTLTALHDHPSPAHRRLQRDHSRHGHHHHQQRHGQFSTPRSGRSPWAT